MFPKKTNDFVIRRSWGVESLSSASRIEANKIDQTVVAQGQSKRKFSVAENLMNKLKGMPSNNV